MKQFDCNCSEAFAIDEADTHTSVCVSVGKEGLRQFALLTKLGKMLSKL